MKRKQQTKQIDGQTVLDNEAGNKFYHRALSPKARAKKRASRRQRRVSRKRNK